MFMMINAKIIYNSYSTTFKFYNVKNMEMSVMKTIYFVFIANEYF